MKEFEYPICADIILQKKRSLKRELLQNTSLIEKKIAILSGSTIGEIKNILELFLLNYGIKPVFYVGGYSLFYENLVFDDGELADFAPDIIYIHTSNKNILNMPCVTDDENTFNQKLSAEFDRYERAWQSAEKYNCPVIQNNFELPTCRTLGNFDAVGYGGMVRFINSLNLKFADFAAKHKSFYINDINYLSARFGLDNWSSDSIWYLYKYSLNTEYIPYLCENISFIIKSIFGKNKKSLILDLDNTLWGGIIGDDGAEGISLGNETPQGMAYLAFCKYLKQLQTEGIMLNVASKNDEAVALSGFELPQNPLKREDFVCFNANWQPKNENVLNIIKNLNILPEAFVFVDDNPAEREIVRQNVAGVVVPEVSDVESYVKAIDRAGFFEVTTLSADDKNRNEMYRQNILRAENEKSFTDYSVYLKSLEMTAKIAPFDLANAERITQLTNKTNQFNLTTRRYTQSEIEGLVENEKYI
ncbi:MAG: HAD-IIIC family phosphatase, partial [Oscillospiraceae bacterium]